MVPAGRRSGKTELAKRRLVKALWETLTNPRPWADPRFFAGAPTRDQARDIYWNDLKALVPPAWLAAEPSESRLSLLTKWGAELRVVGLDKPQRVEGSSWDGCVIDELADCKPGTWDAHIRPALSDRQGWAWLIGVPDMDAPGQVEYEKMVLHAKSERDPEWAHFAWPSADILPAEEVESAKRTMDPRLFEQEYLGHFILAGGRAFPDFDEQVHVRDAEYDPALPLCWSLDFNVNPMCSGVIQHRNGEVRVIDEIVLPDTITSVACMAFLERARQRKWNLDGLCVYGDPAGNQRRTSAQAAGYTDWIIVRNQLRDVQPSIKVASAPWPIPDTRNAVNAKLKNAEGKASLFINPRCRQLREDLRSLLWPSDLSEGHCAAWLRYFMAWEYPVRTNLPPLMETVAVL